MNQSSEVTATDSLIQGSFDDQNDPKQRELEHPKSLPPWLDIIVFWQHTKADQEISATWNLKSSKYTLPLHCCHPYYW